MVAEMLDLARIEGGSQLRLEDDVDLGRLAVASAERLRRLASARGADVILSNHTRYDGSTVKLPAMARRRSGDPHPYVVGVESVWRYLTVAAECARAGLGVS